MFHVCRAAAVVVLTRVRSNSKTLSRISFKLGTHMYLGQEMNPILR